MNTITPDTQFSVSWTETVKFNTRVTAAQIAEALGVSVDHLTGLGPDDLAEVAVDLADSDLIAEARAEAWSETKERTDMTVTVTPTG
jgi:hypothetical protein